MWYPLTYFAHSLEAGKVVRGLVGVLDEIDDWIDGIPLLKEPQRFGNRAFKIWGRRLEEVLGRARARSLSSLQWIELLRDEASAGGGAAARRFVAG